MSNYPDSSHKKESMTYGLIDKNTYYTASNIQVYPASNSVDTAKILSELNLRHMTTNITDLNYVIEPNPGGYDIEYNRETKQIDIKPGRALINGFEVLTDIVVSYRLPTKDELYTGEKYKHKYENYALLCLHTIFDSMSNLSGNMQVGETWYFEGIHVCYPSAEEYEEHENEYLLLGGVSIDGNVIINDEKFQHFDASDILVRLESDPETGAPPKQSSDLERFINNYLHAYWVSKAGDNEYGCLIFRVEPEGYYDPKFDYLDEPPLTDTSYAAKICKVVEQNHFYGFVNVKGIGVQGDKEAYDYDYEFEPNDNNSYEDQVSLKPLEVQFKHNVDDSDDFYDARIKWKKPVGENQRGLFVTLNNSNLEKAVNVEDDSSKFRVDSDNITNSNFEVYMEYDLPQRLPSDTTRQSNNCRSDILVKARNDRTKTTNYLMDELGDITTHTKIKGAQDKEINISSIDNTIRIKSNAQEVKMYVEENGPSNPERTWWNVLNIQDNIDVSSSGWFHDFLVVGNRKDVNESDSTNVGVDPSKITVPDFAHGGERELQSGDVYATQVWSAVYNDIAEMFDVSDSIDRTKITGLLLAVDTEHPNKYTLADKKKNNIIVGIISENPGLCTGGASCENGIPVALAGRVKVKYCGKLKPGNYVGTSNKPGYVKKCFYFSKHRCGKVLSIIDNETAEVLVLM